MSLLVLEVPRVTGVEADAMGARAAHAAVVARWGGPWRGFWALPNATDWQPALDRALSPWRRDRSLRHVVVLGIGGSALGCKALGFALGAMGPLGARHRTTTLTVCDNVDPAVFGDALMAEPAGHTLVFVISKSGGTSETMAQLAVAVAWLERSLGERWRDHVIAITDPSVGALRAFASAQRLPSLALPADVGGRFSALSAVGLAPLAAVGIDVDAILRGAAMAMPALTAAEGNPALALSAWLHHHGHRGGRNVVVMMMYSDVLQEMGAWFSQLWAESLGKRGEGPTPLVCRGTTDQHSLLQLFAEGPDDKAYIVVHVHPDAATPAVALDIPEPMRATWGDAPFAGASMATLLEASRRGTVDSLVGAGRPVVTLSFPALTAEALGAFMMLWQAACAYAGAMAGVDAYDQPGVEDAKQRTKGWLADMGADAPERGTRFSL